MTLEDVRNDIETKSHVLPEDYIKVNLTIPIPFDKPDANGTVYSQKAVEKAVNSLHKNLPIRDDNGKVLGTTTGTSHIATWDFENQVCKMTVEGMVYYGGAECVINEMRDETITDFTIVGLGLSK